MSTHNALKTAFIFMSLTVLGGCSASMQVVRKDARGGEIAVWGATMPAQAQARHAMLEHCQGRFAVAALRDHHGLGASDAISLPSEAQVLSYRCASASRTLASNHTTLAQSE